MSNAASSTIPSRISIPAILLFHSHNHSTTALVDSGSDANFMDEGLAARLRVPLETLESARAVNALDGRLISRVTHRTGPLTLRISGNHSETIQLLIIPSPASPIVLGLPWLKLHNPMVDWTTMAIAGWSVGCHARCLRAAGGTPATSVVPSLPPDLSTVPSVYHDLAQVFSKDKACTLPPHRPFDCAIDLLPGAPLPTSRLFNISRPERLAMEKYVRECLDAGFIRPSSAPLGAGFFFVEKKDHSLRPCIDYRGLNRITIKNKTPLPLIDPSFEPLSQAQFFTKLDLRNAYHLVRIREGDEWKTAFNTPMGQFEYRVMPFGLTNAPAVFQSLMNNLFRDITSSFAFIYLDDILIFSRSLTEHQQQVRLVLRRLLENRLYVKPEKCEFHVASVRFLGFVIARGQVEPDPDKIRAVADWPIPGTRKDLQRFLGFANFYRRFVRDFSRVAAPLTALTSTKASFCWTPEAQGAFSKLRSLFTSAPILRHPDSARQFVVEVDASEAGVGAVLSQRDPSTQKLHPCAFFSKRLSPAEKNYDVGNRELLAVVLALQEWRHWLEGSLQPFWIWTDHKNLAYIQAARRLNSRQARWALFLSRFQFTLSYRPGSKNGKPDALSRIFPPPASPDSTPILPSECIVGAATWEIESVVQEAQRGESVPEGGPADRLFVPRTVRSQVLQWGHSSKLTCHPGARRTALFIRQRFWWPGLDRDTRAFVAACPECARGKASHQASAGLLQPLPVPGRPWSHIGVDFVTGLPPSDGNTTILTIVDRFSKAVHYVPLTKLPSALETAELLVLHVFRIHGIPMDIVSDRGPQFASKVWGAFCRAVGARASLSSGYHPQSNGQTERANQDLGSALRCIAARHPVSWSKFLPWVEYAHNSLSRSATGMSPFMVCFGFQPPLFQIQEAAVAVPSVDDHLRRIQEVWDSARAAITRSGEINKKMADRHRVPAPAYRVGQQVWLSAKDLPLATEGRKMNPRYVGPYPIEQIVNPSAVRLTLPAALKVHPTFHVSLLKPVGESEFSPPANAPPAPLVIEGHPAHRVSRILDVRRRGRGFQYLVDWEGYGPEERSWLPRRQIFGSTLFREFYRDNPGKPGRPPGGAR